MNHKNTALLEEISDINNSIISEQKRLESQQEKNSNSEIFKSIKLSIINLQKDLLEKQHSLKVNNFDELKIILANKLSVGSLDELSYNNIIKDINNYANAFKTFTELKSTEYDLEIIKINEYGEDFKKRHEAFFKLQEEDFNKQIQYFIKNFSLYKVSPKKGNAVINKSAFDLNDMENLFNELAEFVKSAQFNTANLTNEQNKVEVKNEPIDEQVQIPTQLNTPTVEIANDFSSIIADALPSSDIKNITCIDDFTTRMQLCNLYNVHEVDNIQILAVHHFNNKTLGDLLGNPKKIYEELHDTRYDTPIGEQVGLYCFNINTGSIIQMKNKVPTVCLSKGQKLNISHSDSQTVEDEIATVDFSGLNLSFYIDNTGKMRVARNVNRILQEIPTKTLEDLQDLKNKPQAEANSNKNVIQEELNIEKEDQEIKLENSIADLEQTAVTQTTTEEQNSVLPIAVKKVSLIRKFLNKIKSFFTYSAQTNGDV